MRGIFNIFTGFAVVCMFALNASASFVLFDDFESYTVNTDIDGDSGWVAHPGYYNVKADPDDAGNQTLNVVATKGKRAYAPLGTSSIADGTTGTVFMRFMWPNATGDSDIMFGLSDESDPWAGTSQFEANMISNEDTDNNQTSTLGYIGSGGTTYQISGGGETTSSVDTWYSLWIVADNNTDTTKYYIEGGAWGSQTELINGNGGSFRNGTTDALGALMFLTYSNDGCPGGVYFDDIYVDTTGENLVNPVPEPSTLSLMALGSLAMLWRRRRKTSRL